MLVCMCDSVSPSQNSLFFLPLFHPNLLIRTVDDADAIANKTGAGSEAVIDAKMQQVCLALARCIELVSVKCHHAAGTPPCRM